MSSKKVQKIDWHLAGIDKNKKITCILILLSVFNILVLSDLLLSCPNTPHFCNIAPGKLSEGYSGHSNFARIKVCQIEYSTPVQSTIARERNVSLHSLSSLPSSCYKQRLALSINSSFITLWTDAPTLYEPIFHSVMNDLFIALLTICS